MPWRPKGRSVSFGVPKFRDNLRFYAGKMDDFGKEYINVDERVREAAKDPLERLRKASDRIREVGRKKEEAYQAVRDANATIGDRNARFNEMNKQHGLEEAAARKIIDRWKRLSLIGSGMAGTGAILHGIYDPEEDEKQAEDQEYAATLDQMPAYMLGGGALGYGAGEIAALKGQLPLAQDLGSALKAQQLLAQDVQHWHGISQGRPYAEVMENLKMSPEDVQQRIRNVFARSQEHQVASEAIPKLKQALKRMGLKRRALGVGGGLGAGILLATALGAMDKESADRSEGGDRALGAGIGGAASAVGGGYLGGMLADKTQTGKQLKGHREFGGEVMEKIRGNLRRAERRGNNPDVQAKLLNMAKQKLQEVNKSLSKHRWKGRSIGAALGLGTGALAGYGISHLLRDPAYRYGTDDALFSFLEN